jgi:glycosyltransferase involved in cell wall biosynthesis
MKPKISIIVPVYNVDNYLEDCINSLINQTFQEIEIILINDGSTDLSGKICQGFADKDKRIKYFHRNNQGVSSSRNFGIQIASGDFILFVDSDDWIDAETCEVSYNLALRNSADVVMFSYIREYPEKSIKKKINIKEGLYEYEKLKNTIQRRMVGLQGSELKYPNNADSLSPVCMKLYCTNILKNSGVKFLDIELIGSAEDALFNLECFSFVKRFIFINKHFYHYRKGIKKTLTTCYRPWLYEKWTILHNQMDFVIYKNNLGPNFKEALNNRICMSIIGLGLNELNALNKKNTFQKMRFLREVLKTPEYVTAYKNLQYHYFPLHWRFFFLFAKLHFGIGLYLMLLAMKKLKKKL